MTDKCNALQKIIDLLTNGHIKKIYNPKANERREAQQCDVKIYVWA